MSKSNVEKTSESASTAAAAVGPEDQAQRWMKYGANVVLTCVIVIALALLAIWLAQAQDLKLFGKRFSFRARPDLTVNSSNTLKPQTVAIARDLANKVTLVSLYPKLKESERGQKEDTYERVLNILEQYRERNPEKIEVQAIDPIAEPAKLDAWIGQLKRDYGQNISSYEELLRGFPKTLDQIKKLASGQSQAMRQLMQSLGEDALSKLPQEQQEKVAGTINGAFSTVQQFPVILEAIDGSIKTELEKKIPDYEAGKDTLVSMLGQFSTQDQKVSTALASLRDDAAAPAPVRDYAKAAVPVFDQMKKIADDTLGKANSLGKLKLEDVRRKLIPADETEAPPPAIVVMGKQDIRVIDFDSVWKSADSTGLTGASGEKPRLRFAGEQQITSALLALSEQTKKKIAFVRDGGPPLADGRSGSPLSDVADRLRSYNFEVVEKDLSGKWAQQAMRQQQMPQPEPSDEEIKDAVWVALDLPANMEMGGMPSPILAEKLKQHLETADKGADLAVDAKEATLVRSNQHKFSPEDKGDTLEIKASGAWKAGSYKVTDVRDGAASLDQSPAPAGSTGGSWAAVPGSAMLLVSVHADDMAAVLKDYGLEAKTNMVVVHEPVQAAAGAGEDFIEMARRLPPVFVLNQFGDSPITSPINSLDAAIVPMLPITKSILAPKDVTLTQILPVPQEPRSWGETDLRFPPFQRGPAPTFDAAAGDLGGQIYGGALAQKQGAGKLVVIGGVEWAMNNILRIPDPKMERQRLQVARFPANGELFANAIFWLSGEEKMIALSPAAMDTPRIAAMGQGVLNFWRVGIFLIGLPMAALLCGLFVYQARRD